MIIINSLFKTYGSRNIFKDFNLTVKQGEMIAVVGNSGTGKTTLLNIIGSLEAFDSGNVKVSGKDVEKMNHKNKLKFLREEISFLFQNYALMQDKTVYDNIALVQKVDETKNTIVEEVLKDVNLSGFENRLINSLSGGEQQRVALARLMIKPSKLILADEPTGNLDEENSNKVWNILLKLKSAGKTIVVVTHDTQSLHHFDRIIHLI